MSALGLYLHLFCRGFVVIMQHVAELVAVTAQSMLQFAVQPVAG